MQNTNCKSRCFFVRFRSECGTRTLAVAPVLATTTNYERRRGCSPTKAILGPCDPETEHLVASNCQLIELETESHS